jgi:hypothetical protein
MHLPVHPPSKHPSVLIHPPIHPSIHPSSLSLFWYDWNLNSGLATCKTGALSLELQPQSILLWLFWRWGLASYLSMLALNHDPPDIGLLSSQDYGCDPQAPAKLSVLCSLTLYWKQLYLLLFRSCSNNKVKNSQQQNWGHGSSGRAPAFGVQTPEFKTSVLPKKLNK